MSGETNTNSSAAPMVLLVEDHESSADGYAQLLAGAGYRVAHA